MFQFKRFTIEQQGCAMKVGTDGVLLGAWCRVEAWQNRILDVGCGTGLLALMVAQRSENNGPETDAPEIDAIEIEESAYRQAAENVNNSPWAHRIRVVCESFQTYVQGYGLSVYDHIISNPPYFSHSLRSPDAGRNSARHTDTLSYGGLLQGVAGVLDAGGIFSVILPAASFDGFAGLAAEYGLWPARVTDVFPTERSITAKRVLAEFSFTKQAVVRSLLVIENGGRHRYSPEYIELTKDFYLGFG